ncbi:conserved exported hypothetical protein [Tenacibaculum sp. 190524A02b]|uniref:DUF4292 domain-containing protein n=1 Tax=Tenacibaculum vairaonense TaxID=3137860 RepID=A0ABP1FGZ0_9FLAO
MKLVKFILIFLILFTSCKSSKTASENVGVIKEMSARKVAKKHKSNYFNEKTVDAKLKVNYKGTKESLGFSVRMKIKKDEVIWLKGTKLITIFKAKITPEKVSFYSPYKRNYFEGDFSMLKKILGTDINFEQLQNMLLGQAMLDVKSQRQNVAIVEKSYQLSPKKQPNLFDAFFYINPSHYKLNKQSLVNSLKDQRLDISYPTYLNKEQVVFPNKITILAKEKTKFTSIDMTVRSVNFNTNLNLDFSIPAGYKEIQL